MMGKYLVIFFCKGRRVCSAHTLAFSPDDAEMKMGFKMAAFAPNVFETIDKIRVEKVD